MTVRTPTYLLNASSAQRPGGAELRLVTKSLLALRGTSPNGTPLTVTQNGSPNMSVNAAAGDDFIPATEGAVEGFYWAYNDATLNLAIAAADPTNPRRDLVIADVRDSQYSGANNDARLTILQGTPAASPADPDPVAAGYKNYDVIARVAVAALATSIVNANITDLRVIRPYVGLKPVQSTITTAQVTSGATELTVGTISIPAQATAYLIECASSFAAFNSVTDDTFNSRLYVDGVEKQKIRVRHSGSTNIRLPYGIATSTFVTIAVNTACTVTARVQRDAGTGTATVGDAGLVSARLYFG